MRPKRICTKEDDYRRHRGELKHHLRKRGYCGKFIESPLQRVDNLNREKLLEKKKIERVPLVLTHMKQLPNVHGIVRQHLDTLYSSNRMKEVLQEVPIMAYRWDRNLGDLLVHGKTNRVLN